MDITLYDLLRNVQRTNESGRVSKNSPSVVDGMIPHPFDASNAGLRELTPEILLSIKIPVLDYDENLHTVDGFQRDLKVAHARRIGRAMSAGKEMPPVMISVTEDGDAIMTDGQHRPVGAIIEGKPIKAVIEYRTREKAQELFADQKKGVDPPNDTLILSGKGFYNLYIQEAVTNPNHVWFPIAGPGAEGGPGSGNKMTPYSMKYMLVAYVGNQAGTKGGVDAAEDPTIQSRWDVRKADELAELVKTFGTKTTRSEAFTSRALRAIAVAATLIVARQGHRKEDIERWKRHMPLFDFRPVAHLSNTDLTDRLLDHWNKRMKLENKVYRPGR